MSWILLATLGQFIGAVVVFLDKYIVSEEKALPRPFVYAFYSCLLTGFWVFIFLLGYIPGMSSFGVPTFADVTKPTIQVVAMSFLSGYTLFMALVSLYDALKQTEATNVMPVVGAISTLATLTLSYFLLETTISSSFVWGVLILILGTLLVAQTLPKKYTLLTMVHSGLFFGLHYITMKALFEETNFADGFFWSRVGLVAFALSLLMVPSYFKKITKRTKEVTKKTGFIVLLTKILAGISAFMLLKATDLGDVAVVQGLDGLKFVFILLITIFLGSLLPDSVVKLDTRPRVVVQQMVYVLIITIGFLILFL